MPRGRDIRVVGEKRAERLRKLNKRVSNKITRLAREKGLSVQGVDTIKVDEFNSGGYSVKDFNQYVKKMESFLNGDNKDQFMVKNAKGLNIPYYAVLEGEKLKRYINRKRAKAFDKIKDLEFKDRGQTIATVGQRSLMESSRYSEFKPVTFNPNQFGSLGDLKRKLDQLKQRKEWEQQGNKQLHERYKQNYIKSMHTVFGQFGLAEDIINYLNDMDLNDFMKMYFTANLSEIKFVYDKNIPLEDRLKAIRQTYKIAN